MVSRFPPQQTSRGTMESMGTLHLTHFFIITAQPGREGGRERGGGRERKGERGGGEREEGREGDNI